MPTCNRNARRINGCGRSDAVIVRDRHSYRGARETIAEELYDAADRNVTTLRCCDGCYGCREIDTRRRCSYWPSFAHPRWLTCSELNNRRIFNRCCR